MNIAVAGAGVIGLTTAICLQNAGHEVQVTGARRALDATSGAAGAIWYPFRAGPPDKVGAWARATRLQLEAIAADVPEAGVDILTMYEFVDDDAEPWWAEAVDDLVYLEGSLPYPAKAAWVFRSPRVDPTVYLPWLEGQLQRPVQVRRLASLDELDGDVVINCTGLGACELVGDRMVRGLLGQTVLVEPGALRMQDVLSDERNPDAIFYAIPRRTGVILGGCALDSDLDEPPDIDEILHEAILARCIAGGYEPGAVIARRTGLRPFRDEVRVAVEGRVIHNYGHGGAGYTLAWGCAAEVTDLVTAMQPR